MVANKQVIIHILRIYKQLMRRTFGLPFTTSQVGCAAVEDNPWIISYLYISHSLL